MAKHSTDLMGLVRKLASEADTDFLREALGVLVQAIMEAEVTAKAGAERGERSPERLTHLNGRRPRPWATRAGTLGLRIPKVREGTPASAGAAGATSARRAGPTGRGLQRTYVEGVSTRRVEDLVQALGCEGIYESQVSRICQELDEIVEGVLRSERRTRPQSRGLIRL